MEVSSVRTNIVLDDKLVKEGLNLTKLKTKKDLVNLALKEFVERRKRKRILKLEGKVEWEGNLDEMRRSRVDTG
jgi:Arc/MetJ family transcription regulator